MKCHRKLPIKLYKALISFKRYHAVIKAVIIRHLQTSLIGVLVLKSQFERERALKATNLLKWGLKYATKLLPHSFHPTSQETWKKRSLCLFIFFVRFINHVCECLRWKSSDWEIFFFKLNKIFAYKPYLRETRTLYYV